MAHSDVVGLLMEMLVGAGIAKLLQPPAGVIMLSVYVLIGCVVLTVAHVQEWMPTKGHRPWSFEVVARTIRGRNRRRLLILQLLIWLLIGHLMVLSVVLRVILEIGSAF